MNLHILNEALTKYGFSKELKYVDDKFHGHQRGVAICLANLDATIGQPIIYENYLPEALHDKSKNENLLEILNDPAIVKLYQRITQEEKGQLVCRTLVYVPYYVMDHTCFAPTINFDNVDPDLDGSYDLYKADIELLFVCDGTNRYCTLHGLLKNVSIWDAIEGAFEHRELLESMGCVFTDKNSQELTLDFYDEVGEPVQTTFTSPRDLRDRMVSFRLIALGHEEAEKKA